MPSAVLAVIGNTLRSAEPPPAVGDVASGAVAVVEPAAAPAVALPWLPALVVASAELLVLFTLAVVVYAVGAAVFARRLARLPSNSAQELARSLRGTLRTLVVMTLVLGTAGIAGWNGWLCWQGIDAWQHLRERLAGVTTDTWIGLGLALGKLALAAFGVVVATRVLRFVLGRTQAAINRWDRLQDNDQSLAAFFRGLDRASVNTAWLLVVALACVLFGLPPAAGELVAAATRIYLVVAVGVLVIRATAVVVDTLDGLSRHYAQERDWLLYYDRLRPLVPLLRRCLEYALWIGIASLVLAQLPPIAGLAEYGPRLMQAIGIVFLGRVAIEIGRLLINRGMLGTERLDELERRRRATIVPLMNSVFTYACWFGIFVLMLSALGFNPMPFLAGAGVLGLVVGFGAQSLISDVVSGFFILFETVYLVGDVIEAAGPDAAGAKGTVEALEFRITRIRDADGRLHIWRNGDIKQVINYSTDYIKAVVPVEVGYDADLQAVLRTLTECGERLRADCADVLAPLEIDGITGFDSTTLTVRTSIRTKPGRDEVVAAEFRRLLKDAFDRLASATGGTRQGLIPALPSSG